MRIVQASYGSSDGRRIDVTPQAARLAVAGLIAVPSNLDLNFLFSDPDPGVRKTLRLYCEDQTGQQHFFELQEIDGHLAADFAAGEPTRRTWPHHATGGRTVCLYAYYEKNSHYRDNLAFFLRHGLLPDMDYVFVVNGSCTLDFPNARNVRVIYRDNVGFDFGGHSAALSSLTREYDYYFFLNATCRGPFLPPYVQANWTSVFAGLLTEEVHLVGASIAVQYNFNYLPYFNAKFRWNRQYFPAVESYFFLLDKVGLDIVCEAGIFSGCDETDIWEVVFYREISMSLSLLSQDFNIDCMIPEMSGIDYRSCIANFNPSHFTPTRYLGCFGRSLHPFEVIFIKQNRGICDEAIASLSAYFDRPVAPNP